jgi:hypothetical protein
MRKIHVRCVITQFDNLGQNPSKPTLSPIHDTSSPPPTLTTHHILPQTIHHHGMQVVHTFSSLLLKKTQQDFRKKSAPIKSRISSANQVDFVKRKDLWPKLVTEPCKRQRLHHSADVIRIFFRTELNCELHARRFAIESLSHKHLQSTIP